jgi:Flp pilus assembly protein TadB
MTAGRTDPDVEGELRAAIAARQELGTELEQDVIDSFVERIERRLDERARELAPARRDRHAEFVLAIVSLGVAIPLLAIAGGIAGLAGVIAVCTALVLVNLVFRR